MYMIYRATLCLFLLSLSFSAPVVKAQSAGAPAPPRVYLDTKYRAPSGATINVAAGGDLQAALNSAKPGDTIVLQAGATYTPPFGGYTLPYKDNPGNQWIIIRTSNLAGIPAEGTRVVPSTHSAAMPKLITPNGNKILRTSTSTPHHYRFIGVEFGVAPGVMSVNSLISFGTSGSSQDTLAEVSHDLVLDRCYIHGNDVGSARRGVELNSASSAIIDSYVANFHHADGAFDSQAVCVWNSPGPLKIVNNYLEAASENIMFGGSDPSITSLIPSDIEIRQNYFRKPSSWKDYIIKQPSSPSVAVSSAVGSLAGGMTYYYQVTARGVIGGSTVGTSLPTVELKVTLTSGQHAAKVSWGAARSATEYRIYRTVNAPGTTRTWVYYTATSTSFTDVGASGTTGSAPPTTASKWVVKNLLELKNAQRLLIDGNIFENNWKSGQVGYALVFKSVNQDGNAPWSVTQDVQVTNNYIRHVAAGVNVLGFGGASPSGRTQRILLANNLFEDLGGVWGAGTFFTNTEAPADITLNHNTVFQTGQIISADNGQTVGFRFTNNIAPHNKYGVKGSGTSLGIPTLDAYYPACVFLGNVIAGASSSAYPLGNYYPASLNNLGFVNLSGGDYRLSATSPYKYAGTDGKDPGCDIDTLKTALGPGNQ